MGLVPEEFRAVVLYDEFGKTVRVGRIYPTRLAKSCFCLARIFGQIGYCTCTASK